MQTPKQFPQQGRKIQVPGSALSTNTPYRSSVQCVAKKPNVEEGKLVQTNGSGSSGSFMIKAQAKKPAIEKNGVAKKPQAAAAVKKPKAAVPKKVAEKKAKAVTAKTAKKAGTVKKAAAPQQKATKPTKTAAKQPKTPKPNKTPAPISAESPNTTNKS